LHKNGEGKKFAPNVRVIRSLLQQTTEAYMFCKLVANILLKYLGLFITNSVLSIGLLLLILVRYLLCSSRLMNI